MEPEAAVLAKLATCFYLDNRPGTLAKMPAYEVIVIYLAQKAYTLRIPPVRVRQFRIYRYTAHI